MLQYIVPLSTELDIGMLSAVVMEEAFLVLQALGIADRKSTKAIKLNTAKQRKQHAKGLWSKAE